MNYQGEVAILTDFWQKTAKRSKNEEINRKKAKYYQKKSKKVCANFQLEMHFQALLNIVASISEDGISIYNRIKIISTGSQIKSEKIGPFRRKNG